MDRSGGASRTKTEARTEKSEEDAKCAHTGQNLSINQKFFVSHLNGGGVQYYSWK
jgi:hypothetical protein